MFNCLCRFKYQSIITVGKVYLKKKKKRESESVAQHDGTQHAHCCTNNPIQDATMALVSVFNTVAPSQS